jgi:hypothetical protein
VLTEMRYTLDVAGTTVEGALHIPRDGTEELVAAALAAATTERRGGKGPHGGVVQVVGEDIVEIVGRVESRDVRVYLLDTSLQTIRTGERKVALSMVLQDSTAFIAMDNRGGIYYDAEFPIDSDPAEITVVVTEANEADVALVGYEPGDAIAAGRSAPKVPIFVAEMWDVIVVGDGVVDVEDEGWKGSKPKKPKKGKGKDRREDDD